MTMNIEVEKIAFESKTPDRGFTVKASYLTEPKGDALIEIFRDGTPYRRFLYPAYKIWNIAAHFDEIVTSEIDGNFNGYDAAGWTGFSVVQPRPVPPGG
jgi:hypothetical protein